MAEVCEPTSFRAYAAELARRHREGLSTEGLVRPAFPERPAEPTPTRPSVWVARDALTSGEAVGYEIDGGDFYRVDVASRPSPNASRKVRPVSSR